VSSLVVDALRSKVAIRTFAEGLFARLAHDLELNARDLSGTADAEAGAATLIVPLDAIEIAGTLSDRGLDTRGLSESDRRDALRKMRDDVFHARAGESVKVEARLEGTRARIRVVPPHGRTWEKEIPVEILEDRRRVSGRCEISLAAIGARVVKGPMNAFRVKDAVLVLFDVVFQPA
jgi:hypothetical protein